MMQKKFLSPGSLNELVSGGQGTEFPSSRASEHNYSLTSD